MTTNDATPSPEALEVVREAHARLLSRVEGLDDEALRGPSRLPRWSVGHVLTHLARNADSFVRMLEAARRGEHVRQYESSEVREAEIESGASRTASEVVSDLSQACRRLEEAFAGATPENWAGHGLTVAGSEAPCRNLPARRRREVEIHHVDLGLGYEVDDWSDDFVLEALYSTLSSLPERISSRDERARFLAWVLGRSKSPGEITLAGF